MSYYIYIWPIHDKEHFGVWDVQPTHAIRVGVYQPKEHQNCYVEADGGDIWAAIRKRLPNCTFVPLDLEPGQYYPRMARPHDQHPRESSDFHPNLPRLENEVENYRGQLAVLTSIAGDLPDGASRCRYARYLRAQHSQPNNFGMYGS